MAHAAVCICRQSLSWYSLHRNGICGGLQALFFVAGVRNFSSKMGLPRVYFDMSADGQPVGRIVMEVSKFSINTFVGAAKNSMIAQALHCDCI
jgi:hypothetical protein